MLNSCTERDAEVRCGGDSRTVASIANHVADWLGLVAETLTALSPARGLPMPPEVVDEIDADFAKASAGRTWNETRRRLSESAANLQRAIHVHPPNDLGNLRGWTVAHVQEHAAQIRAALLVASAATETNLTQEGLR